MGGSESKPDPGPDTRAIVNGYYAKQVIAYVKLQSQAVKFNVYLIEHRNYMLQSDYERFIGESSKLLNNLPTALSNVQERRVFGIILFYTYSVNNNFDSQMAERYDAINKLYSNAREFVLNNCDNPNTAISQNMCGIGDVKSKFQEDILPNKTISNNIVNSLTQTSPQYTAAKTIDNAINNAYDWNYMSNTFNEAGANFSTYNKDTVTQTYSMYTTFVQNAYNNCTDSTGKTLISLNDNGKPNCLGPEYDKANATCSKGISQSKVYQYDKGTELLTKLWTDVSNSIPGNTLQAGRTVLTTAQDSCNKWVQMFNVWEEKEAEAIATPCNPERTIQTTYDPAMLKMAEDWNRAASSYIESLMKRLEVITRYIETYPHILQLRENDVTFGPHSLGASMLLKYKVNELKPGVAPVQYLEMLVPNGAPGETGEVGPVGLPGKPGRSGPLGKIGKTGDPTLPSVYQ